MELDFDKEMDALLRREAAGRTITISERSGLHLDADEIAAFAEGAVPDRSRQTFVLHFAECDACRRTLANAIALRSDEVPAAAESVAAPAVAPAAALPWYRKLFLFPNLAYVMGGLVVLFAGFIGVSLLTRSYMNSQSEVSSVRTGEAPAAAPEPQISSAPAANSNASVALSTNSMSNAANAAAPSEQALVPSANTAANAVPLRERSATADKIARDLQPQAEPAPPPPAAARQENTFSADGVEAKRPQDTRITAAAPHPAQAAKDDEQSVTADVSRGRPMAKMAGPARNDRRERGIALEAETDRAKKASRAPSGTGNSAAAVQKTVGGRTFELRQGAWYETTYQGQGTVNVRRNSEEYKKLDRGVRGIAENFIGAVVVTIWNGKAYRIQ